MTNTNDIRRFFGLKEDTNVKEGLLELVYNFCQEKQIASDWYAYDMMESVGAIETEKLVIISEKPVIISRESDYYKAFETAVAIEDIATTFENNRKELETVLKSCSQDLRRLEYLRKMLDKRYSAKEIEYCFKNRIFLEGEYHKKFDYAKIKSIINDLNYTTVPDILLYNIPVENLMSLVEVYKFRELSMKTLLEKIDEKISLATEEKINCIAMAATVWQFKPWEVNLFIPILFEMNDIEVNKLILFMSASKKEELFKKIFDI